MLYVLSAFAGVVPNVWIPASAYWLIIALQSQLEAICSGQDATIHEEEDDDDLSWFTVLEYLVILVSSIAYTPVAGCFLVLILAIKRLLWDEQRLPRKFRVDSSYYANGGKRFLITGGASGVGKHMVGAISRLGHRVLATDINSSLLETVAEEEAWSSDLVTLRRLDVTSEADWKAAIEECESQWGGIDVCMNIAGFLKPSKTQNVTARDIELHVGVNVKGVMYGTSLAAALMTRQVSEGRLPKGGHIINFASLGAIAPVQGVGLYIATKYACRGFSLSASKDLFASGVFVTCVMPDAIQTPMVDLQLHFEESAMAYSGDILTLHDVEKVIIERVLPNREREVLIPTSVTRGKGARLADVFSGSLLLNFVEETMRQKGVRAQKHRKEQGVTAIDAHDHSKRKVPSRTRASDRSPSPGPHVSKIG